MNADRSPWRGQAGTRFRMAPLVLMLCFGLPAPGTRAEASAAQAVDGQAIDWAYPLKDPLGVMPPPVLTELAMPADAGMAMPENCERVDAGWGAASPEAARKASAPDVPELGLQDALDLAICHNPALRQSRAMAQGAAAALGQARAAYLPNVNASLTRIKQNQSYDRPTLADGGLYATSKNIGVSWRVYDFGLREHRIQAQARQLEASTAGLNDAVRKIVLDVAQFYFGAQNAAAMRNAKLQSLELARQILQSTLNRADKGLADMADVLQARSAVARAEYELSVSKGEAEKARASLAQLLGVQQRLGHAYRVSTADAEAVLKIEPEEGASHAHAAAPWADFERWLHELRQGHPAIAAARAQVASAQHNLQATRLEGMPSIDLSWNQYENGRPNQTLSAVSSVERTTALSLRIPLFDGFAQTYKVRAAQAQLEQKKAELAAVESQVLKDALFLHTEAEAALANLKSARQLAVAAQQATGSIQRKYEQGASDLVQLNQSASALTAARSELVKCWTEWQSARIRVVAATSALRSANSVTKD